MKPTRTEIAAIMVVRNEQHLIAASIGHLLTTVGVSRVYVVDNGSSDRAPDILSRIAAGTGRVVLQSDPGAFHQARIVTVLAERATADGAGWLLPTDADEFLWLRQGLSLAALCQREGIGGYRVPVCNFLQARPVRRDWRGSLATMCVSALPFGEVADGRAAVESGRIPFVRINYPGKQILRATPGLRISTGNHLADDTAGPIIALEGVCMLHAPIRSMQQLRSRVEAGQRAAAVLVEPGQGWHVKRMAAMAEPELAEEWARNTYSPLHPVQRGSTRFDVRLARIGLRQDGFSARFSRGGSRTAS